MIRHRQIQPHQLEQRADQPLGLPQRLVKHRPQDQRCLDREIRVACLSARRGPWRRPPRGDRLVREPDRQRAALPKPGLVVSPVRHLIAGLRNPMATVGIVFVRHGQAGRSGRRSSSIQCHSPRQPPHPCTKPTAQGRCGSLFLHRSGLSPPTPCQSPGALPRFLVLSWKALPSPVMNSIRSGTTRSHRENQIVRLIWRDALAAAPWFLMLLRSFGSAQTAAPAGPSFVRPRVSALAIASLLWRRR
jgi:hypothetical protein